MKLVGLMREKGYSFRDLAEGCGVSLSTIERIAYSKIKDPHPKTKRLIANFFGVKIGDIDEFKEPGVEEEVT